MRKTKNECSFKRRDKVFSAPLLSLRISGMPEVRDMKLITPVRRSARIERAVSRYPEMLQDHDLVVSSLNELLEVEDTECFVFRKNEALPITLGFQVLES